MYSHNQSKYVVVLSFDNILRGQCYRFIPDRAVRSPNNSMNAIVKISQCAALWNSIEPCSYNLRMVPFVALSTPIQFTSAPLPSAITTSNLASSMYIENWTVSDLSDACHIVPKRSTSSQAIDIPQRSAPIPPLHQRHIIPIMRPFI